jgi:hypothetical protein
VSEAFNEWVMSLTQPYCGNRPEILGDLLDSRLQSFVIIPLGKKAADRRPFGALILGAEDKDRFKVGMGTLYLEHIGELVAATLLNHLFALNL